MDGPVVRDDGSVVEGLTVSTWKMFLKRFSYLTEEELIIIRDFKSGHPFDKENFVELAYRANHSRAVECIHGIPATQATSLFMLLSVHVKPRKSSFLSIYGEITSHPAADEGVYIYKTGLEDVENFESSDGGYLSLNGPPSSCWSHDVGVLLQTKNLSIRLYDQKTQQPLFVDNSIVLDYSGDYIEQIRKKAVRNTEISITLKYVSIPMGVYGRLDFNILHLKEDPNLSEYVDVCGKVVANSKFTFGKYKSQEIVLFDKNPDQYEKLHLGKGKNLLSFSGSRCWVVAQACSLLNIHIDLVNPQKEIILKQDVELETCSSYGSCKEFVSGKYFVSVRFSWFTTSLQPPKGLLLIRSLEPCTPDLPQPRPASAIEVFSVLLVCHEKPLQIHGYLRFTSDRKSDVYETGIDIFKREKDHPLALKGSGLHTISVSNGSRLLADFKTLSMACDLEDVMACDLEDTRNKSSIKGLEYLDMKRYAGQQLCSIFQGNYGFAALHYTVFPSAVQVKVVKVNFRKQKGLQCDVFGSICAQYKGFDYSSQYKKDCYRIVLFKRDMGDSAKMDVDGLIPLSKSTFVVPSPSSAMLDLDLMIGSRKFSSVIDVSMGIGNKLGEYTERIIEGEFEFVLEWREVK